MAHLHFTCERNEMDSLIADLLSRKPQLDAAPLPITSTIEVKRSVRVSKNEGEPASLAAFRLKYQKLPDYLKPCFDFCCLITRFSVEKGKLVRLLLAKDLVQEKPGDVKEDVAKMIVQELVSLELLQVSHDGSALKVPEICRQLFPFRAEKQDFVSIAANSPIDLSIEDDGVDLPPSLKSLHVRSLLLITSERLSSCYAGSGGLSHASMYTICGLKFLHVLDLDGKIEYLPNEVGDLVHLRYLGLVWSRLDELPPTLGNLQNVQTLDIRHCRHLRQLPKEILNIESLRHLLMSRCINDGEIIVPKEIGSLVNLHTLCGVYAGNGIARELRRLNNLRELGVKRMSEDHASELSAAIMNMENLVSLSLEAERTSSVRSCTSNFWEDVLFPELEPFVPPPLVQELNLQGGLVEIPNWIASMANLETLYLSFSYLQDNPSSVLQNLPNLKHLSLWEAYRAKLIGKEFCEAGGFPKLETLTIASSFLEDWTEIVDGAFPRLRCLSLRNCLKLRFLPEGLQNVSTLQELCLMPLHHDLGRRLKGDENYKIKHITTLTLSVTDADILNI